jgi:hypothetical protein
VSFPFRYSHKRNQITRISSDRRSSGQQIPTAAPCRARPKLGSTGLSLRAQENECHRTDRSDQTGGPVCRRVRPTRRGRWSGPCRSTLLGLAPQCPAGPADLRGRATARPEADACAVEGDQTEDAGSPERRVPRSADATDEACHEQHGRNADRIQFRCGVGAGLLLRRCKEPRLSRRELRRLASVCSHGGRVDADSPFRRIPDRLGHAACRFAFHAQSP